MSVPDSNVIMEEFYGKGDCKSIPLLTARDVLILDRLTTFISTPAGVINEMYDIFVGNLLACQDTKLDSDCFRAINKMDTVFSAISIIGHMISHPNLDEGRFRLLLTEDGDYSGLTRLIEKMYCACKRFGYDTDYFLHRLGAFLLHSPYMNTAGWQTFLDIVKKSSEDTLLDTEFDLPDSLAYSPLATPDGLRYLWKYQPVRTNILANPNTDKKFLTQIIYKMSMPEYADKYRYKIRAYINALCKNPALDSEDLVPLLFAEPFLVQQKLKRGKKKAN